MKQVLIAGMMAAQTVLLSACGSTFDFSALRQQDFNSSGKGEPFQVALGEGYKNFALYEVDEMYDWIDAAHFGDKARRAAGGLNVAPEKTADWWLTQNQMEVLSAARKRLLAVLDAKSKSRLPLIAAKAQTGFDCWMEQQEENWQNDHIAKCRNQFVAAVEQLEDLETVANSKFPIVSPDVGSVPVLKTKTVLPENRETNAFTLYFSFDTAEIDAANRQAIDRIVELYSSGAPVTISLAGHADRAGPQPYNFKLSRRRAEAVRKTLIENGAPVQMSAAQAFGESRPRKKTTDGVRDAQNRRVEIIVGPASSL